MNIEDPSMVLLKKQLTGSNLIKLIIHKKLSKYRVAVDCGLSWRTIHNWIQEKSTPSDDNASIVGAYLGLIPPSEIEKQELKKEIDKLSAKVDRLGKLEE